MTDILVSCLVVGYVLCKRSTITTAAAERSTHIILFTNIHEGDFYLDRHTYKYKTASSERLERTRR